MKLSIALLKELGPRNQWLLGILFILVGLLLSGCSAFQSATDSANQPSEVTEATEVPELATVAPPLSELEAPSELIELPLAGSPVDIPDIWIVPSLQSKQMLAAYLRTDETQLDWVNPGLPDPVPPGTLVVIPPGYLAHADVPLADVAKSIGVSTETLLAANPHHSVDETVLAGTVLVVPTLHFVREETLLSSAADALNVSSETLLSANPELAHTGTIGAGAVLVVPPEEIR